MSAETPQPSISHGLRCKRPTPVLRLSWKRTPELFCPGCGRTCPAPVAGVDR